MWSPVPWALETGGFLKEVAPGGAGRGWEKGACIWVRGRSVGWKQPGWGGGLLTASAPSHPAQPCPGPRSGAALGSAVRVTAPAAGWWLLWASEWGREWAALLEGIGRGLSRCRVSVSRELGWVWRL